jgi:hypothetical protein
LVWALYHNKFTGLTVTAPTDNTASVNAAIDALAASAHSAVQSLAATVNNFSLSSDGARSADTNTLNTGLSTQWGNHNNNVDLANTNFNALSGYPVGIGQLPAMLNESHVNGVSMTTTAVGGGITAPDVPAPPPVQPGGAGGATDPLAPTRDAHLSGVAAQTTVPGVAAYDITAGW